jgi:hypothetical protein
MNATWAGRLEPVAHRFASSKTTQEERKQGRSSEQLAAKGRWPTRPARHFGLSRIAIRMLYRFILRFCLSRDDARCKTPNLIH